MKAKELIELLQTMSPELEVKIDTEGYSLSIVSVEQETDIFMLDNMIRIKG